MKRSILLIDDQESMRGIISRLLKERDFEVTTAGDGEEGYRLFSQDPEGFQLILADVNMPVIDGFEFLKRVKNLYPNKPVILITGVNQEAAQVVGTEYKADAIISKPFNVEEALSVIEKVLSPT